MTPLKMKQTFKQHWRTIASVSASFVMVLLLVQSYRNQRQTDQRLLEIQKELRDVSAAHPSSARESLPTVIIDSGNGGSEEVRRQHNLSEIESAGWKLINQRSPEQAAVAVRIFNEGIENVDSTSPELYDGLGRALLVAGKPGEAIATWRKGLALAPNFSDMQSGIGWAYWQLNDPSRAREAWKNALAMNPHSPDAWSAMAWIDLAFGENAEAKNGFQELVNFDPEQKSWIAGLSMARGNNDDVQEISQFFPLPALSMFNRPLTIDPAVARP
jgi:tetratricopeptide (TPR) repeat protein